MNGDISFVVYIPGSRENVGGHVVLHKFVAILSELGFEVWTTEEPMFSCKANIIRKKDKGEFDLEFLKHKDPSKVVAVYPEQIEGNPFGIENVSRWILYHTSVDVEKTWKSTDEFFYFQPGFLTARKEDSKKILTILDTKVAVCGNKGIGSKRNGYCHINKKKYPEGETIMSNLASTDLGDFMDKGGFTYLVEEMNKYEYFVTFDDATHYSVIAALCGCRSVILRQELKTTPDEYRAKYPTHKYGVAFGWEDIKHADMTRDIVRQYMQRYEKESIESTKRFIEFWNNKINSRS
jgi:hypothetical protein